MKHNKKIVFIILIYLFLLFVCSCDRFREAANEDYKKVKINLSDEVFCIVEPDRNVVLNNLVITSADKRRIICNITELKNMHVITLLKGRYEFKSAGIQPIEFDINNDSKVKSNGRSFTLVKTLPTPEPLLIVGPRSEKGNLISVASYNFSIIDIENLDESPSSYKATISGRSGTLNFKTENNNRMISDSFNLAPGNYTVSISGTSTTKIPSLNFTVDPESPFTVTLDNRWNGNALRYANISVYKYKTSPSTSDIRTIMPRRDNAAGTPSYNAFDFTNNKNIVRINSQTVFRTGNTGKIVLTNSVNTGDYLIIFVLGVKLDDDVYSYVFPNRITQADRNKEITINWNMIPSKGERSMTIPVHSGSLDDWKQFNNYTVYFYYKQGDPANFDSSEVFNSFTKISSSTDAVKSRPNMNDIFLIINLSGISMASSFNYLLEIIDVENGTLIMSETSAESSDEPNHLKKKEW